MARTRRRSCTCRLVRAALQAIFIVPLIAQDALVADYPFGRTIELESDLLDALDWVKERTADQVPTIRLLMRRVLKMFLQVVAEREAIISQIEKAGAEFHSSGECASWFGKADPRVCKVQSVCHCASTQFCRASLLRSRRLLMVRCCVCLPKQLTTKMPSALSSSVEEPL